MDLEMILRHQAQAEKHIAEGYQHVARQREIVAELERDGHDSALSRELLTEFEKGLATDIEIRDLITKELAASAEATRLVRST
jgi:hypothetical protein